MGHSPELCDLALEVALMGSGTSKGFLTSILQQQIRAEPRGWEERHKTPSTKLQRFDFDSFSSPLQEGGAATTGESQAQNGNQSRAENNWHRMPTSSSNWKGKKLQCAGEEVTPGGPSSGEGAGSGGPSLAAQPSAQVRDGSSVWKTRKGNATP